MPSVMRILRRLEEAQILDGPGDKLQSAVQAAVRPQQVRNALHGTWLGHPLHPVLVQFPVGAFMSAALLDLLPGRGRAAATTLIAAGTAGAAPAIAAGLLDWSQMSPERRRVGLVHAAFNGVALSLYTGSLVARLRGRAGLGRILGYAGLSAAGLGAYLGGHLAYAQAGGANQAAPETIRVPEEWTAIGSLADLPDGQPVVRSAGDVSLLVYRLGDRVTAMIERCSHETGPLGEGKVVGQGRDACVVCPWHGSTFRLTDGKALEGPAANDQPLLRTRVEGGMVEVSSR
jgi:nitrite reductase/ring-hydroxylating ferredoxin subunit/uncharacterized membrane protein